MSILRRPAATGAQQCMGPVDQPPSSRCTLPLPGPCVRVGGQPDARV